MMKLYGITCILTIMLFNLFNYNFFVPPFIHQLSCHPISNCHCPIMPTLWSRVLTTYLFDLSSVYIQCYLLSLPVPVLVGPPVDLPVLAQPGLIYARPVDILSIRHQQGSLTHGTKTLTDKDPFGCHATDDTMTR